MRHLKLGVNIDHVATLRQARGGLLPDPLCAAKICEGAGAEGITAHLREDRRHIQDADMRVLANTVSRLNMEMAVTDEMLEIACTKIHPAHCCLVPEKRQELTTEGGLNAVGLGAVLANAVPRLQSAGIQVSLFIDPEFPQIDAAKVSGAQFIEMHTGAFANASGTKQKEELKKLIRGAEYAHSLGLGINAGHGIDYENIALILEIPHLNELNIGHSIISRAVFTGLADAVRELRARMDAYAAN